MRRCLVRAMYLSASAVAVYTKGRYNKCSTFSAQRNSAVYGSVVVHNAQQPNIG